MSTRTFHFTPDDVGPVFQACQDEEIHRWTVTLPWPYTEQHAREWIEGQAAQRETGAAYDFAVVEAQTDTFSGSISLERSERTPRSAGVGYWIAPWARNRGYATEALGISPTDPRAASCARGRRTCGPDDAL